MWRASWLVPAAYGGIEMSELQAIEEWVRSNLRTQYRVKDSYILPEPEEGEELSYSQIRDIGWDQAWSAGRIELLGDVLRIIEMEKEKSRADQ